MVLLGHVVVERLGLARDAEKAGVNVPHGDLVAVGGALAVPRGDVVRHDFRQEGEGFVARLALVTACREVFEDLP